ncbi:hypothetical protein AVEN_249446-1 [Araneus ventricosus]|uniref:Uncharacterized protein n=1 Tax=Araneus ventricosus TaxID=182803 RepID=A0A4Y2QR86_ARAVE|nr:hypothetical protein AVEN_249446-1 [Araneus ventricosus]
MVRFFAVGNRRILESVLGIQGGPAGGGVVRHGQRKGIGFCAFFGERDAPFCLPDFWSTCTGDAQVSVSRKCRSIRQNCFRDSRLTACHKIHCLSDRAKTHYPPPKWLCSTTH